MGAGQAWSERYVGGSPDAERRLFEQLAAKIMSVQLKNRKSASSHGVPHGVDRAFHAKSTLATTEAELRFLNLDPDLEVDFAKTDAAYRTIVRFSNAAGSGHSDRDLDMRGVALRIIVSDEQQHDLLMTNFPVSHARDARQFVEFAHATAGGRLRPAGAVNLLVSFGPKETLRMVRNVSKARKQVVGSVATQTYWGRGAMRWGPTLAVRVLLRPAPDAAAAPPVPTDDPDYLSHEAARRLATGDIRFELCVQRFRDDQSTPIEDTAVEWTEDVAPAVPVAVLTIRQGDVSTPDAIASSRAIQELAFNPWNTTDLFRPLGNLNRARKSSYDASAAHRHQTRWRTEMPLRNVVLGAGARSVFRVVNRYVPWHRLGVRLGLLNLEAFRYVLRQQNLIDTDPQEAPPQARPVPPQAPEHDRIWRSYDGSDNDLSAPKMGAVGASFGRNMAPKYEPTMYDQPNPIVVSRELLYRESFRPATSLNILAAAWIQFQVHDWVNHARHPLGVKDVSVPLPPGMPGWASTAGGPLEPQMRIAGNLTSDDARDSRAPFANAASHWWDGSEVYGANVTRAHQLREQGTSGLGAKLQLPEGYLPDDVRGFEVTGFNESWWLGLSGFHTLFAREHNLLCDELRSHYRGWTDERVYQTARLIVSALIAKIHTVEWTPAILSTDTIDVGLKSNWNGPPANDWMTRLGIWLMDAHVNVGIPKTTPDHHTAPYSLTEDFATVYRLHPLIPDDYLFFDHRTGATTAKHDFLQIQGDKADDILRAKGLEDVLYSFGVSHPGAITLHNYPRALQALERDGERIDLSVVDLVRTRRRGVPRYNDFRAGLHKPRIKRWEDLTEDQESVRRLREVYSSIDEVDTMVGLFAETPPPGFGFSDTAFRIFILMASRRLQSDRFLTVDFRPEIYSPFGMDWIEKNGMTSVILRHCPDLAGALRRDVSAFAPWRPVSAPAPATGARDDRPA